MIIIRNGIMFFSIYTMSTVHCRDLIDLQRELDRVECIITSDPPTNTVAIANNVAGLFAVEEPLVGRFEVLDSESL